MKFLSVSLFTLALFFSHHSLSFCSSGIVEDQDSNKIYTGVGFSQHSANSADPNPEEDYSSAGPYLTIGCIKHFKRNLYKIYEANLVKVENSYTGYHNNSTVLWITSGLKINAPNKIHDFSIILQGGLSNTTQLIMGGALLIPITKKISIQSGMKTIDLFNVATQISLIYNF